MDRVLLPSTTPAAVVFNSSGYDEDDARWCYVKGKADACVKIVILISLAIVTGVLCVLRIIQYHYYRSKNYHQYAVYYTAVLVCILSIIHWVYVKSAAFDFISTYLTVLQLLIISHFFCSWASRILQQEYAFTLIVIPFLIAALMYFTAVAVWGVVGVVDNKHECTHPQWLLFTSSQLVLAQIFLVTVVYITRKLNNVRTTRTNRLSQKAQLWGLAVVYEIVSVLIFAYDLFLLLALSNSDDCAKGITRDSIGVTVVYVVHKVVKYLLPQWAFCVIFTPLKPRVRSSRGDSDREESTLSWTEKPNYQSTFYQTRKEDSEEDHSLHFPINTSVQSSYPILPRNTPLSPNSYQASPWLKALPGQSFPGSQPTPS